ncbi:NADPH oxidase 5 [Chamaea fasciata]|uniref:NADPH oxidase 5 n=1 Tax=Chamaea fasciata TaxID=190680 RepID=UPI00336A4345
MGAAADAEWLRWAGQRFGTGTGTGIGLEEFTAALRLKEPFFAERFFALLDADGSGSLSREELLGSLRRLLRADPTEKLRFLFQVYDVDGSGSIDAEELRAVLRGCLRESSLSLPEERLGALSRALLQALDRDRSGSVTFPELREQLEAFPELLENVSLRWGPGNAGPLPEASRGSTRRGREQRERAATPHSHFPSAASWLTPPDPRPAERSLCCFSRESSGGARRCFSRESSGGARRCFSRESPGGRALPSRPRCLWLWALASALLLAQGALGHRGRGAALALARGCGLSLNLNCALLAALMLRRSLTRLRSTPLAELLPLELHVRGHELVAHLVLALATAHTAGHLAHAGLARVPSAVPLSLSRAAPHTGLALLPLLLAMLLGSRARRRRGHFQVFYWSHLCYIPVWFLLLLHGPHFWKWFLLPGSLFLLEKVLGWARRRAGDLHILEARLLPSKVIHLVIQRPESFRFQPGDYVYLNVPAVAAHEWHPFSISSAPEQPETLWLHIRVRGQWTNRLYEFFRQPEPRGSRRPREQAGSVASGRDGAVELVAFRASGAAFPGKDPEQGVSPAPIPGDTGGRIPNGTKLREKLLGKKLLGCSRGPAGRSCVRSPAGGAPNPGNLGSVWDGATVTAPLSWQGSAESQRSCRVRCFLDGPYGSPSRRIFTSEHAVLIGAGIGITPFASILQSIVFRYRRRKQSCPSCGFSWSEGRRDEEMTLRKVDFIWITRAQQHLQWFLGLLARLEAEQAELEPGGERERPGGAPRKSPPGGGPDAPEPAGNFLELQLYVTSALGKGDVKALGLQLALDLLAAQEKRDSITGLRSRTQPGRPDWDKVFGKVAAERRGKVWVFFCGSAGLARVIRGHCRSFGFAFSKENF